jgi:hypothetical protein
MYLTIIYLQLLILQISSKTMEYICAGLGAVDTKKFTRLICSVQVLGKP